MNNKKITIEAYKFVEENQANSDIYFKGHVLPVAHGCKEYAPHVGADPFIAELGGLFHDCGYSKNHETNSGDHIINGIKIASEYLNELKVDQNTIVKVLDCIRTHDGNLKPTSPIENVVVNDVDSIMFFRHPQTSYDLLKRFDFDNPEILERMRTHADKTLKIIHNSFFKDMGEKAYAGFLSWLDSFKG